MNWYKQYKIAQRLQQDHEDAYLQVAHGEGTPVVIWLYDVMNWKFYPKYFENYNKQEHGVHSTLFPQYFREGSMVDARMMYYGRIDVNQGVATISFPSFMPEAKEHKAHMDIIKEELQKSYAKMSGKGTLDIQTFKSIDRNPFDDYDESDSYYQSGNSDDYYNDDFGGEDWDNY